MIRAIEKTSKSRVVYVIDSDPSVHCTIAKLAQQMGIQCEPFMTGADFLHAVNANAAGCVVSEVQIADMDGVQLQRRLAAAGCPLPIVFLTAHPAVRQAVQATREGAVDFLEKPLDEQQVLEAIQRALELDRTRWHRSARSWELKRLLASLTSQERTIMEGLTAGRKNREIATEEGISLRTVEKLRAHLMAKLGAKSLQDLIRIELVMQC
jgi:two-component system response regulator FixJ